MTLHEILEQPYSNKSILIIGRSAAGKTWLSNQLSQIYPRHHVIHCDDYKDFSEPVAVQALIEDAYENKPSIIEGMLGFSLLLQGAKEQSYRPDVIIEVDISMGKQREIYLKERSSEKLKYQRRFYEKCLLILNEYHKLVPKEEQPMWLLLNNTY